MWIAPAKGINARVMGIVMPAVPIMRIPNGNGPATESAGARGTWIPIPQKNKNSPVLLMLFSRGNTGLYVLFVNLRCFRYACGLPEKIHR